jgi:hypothetical protein
MRGRQESVGQSGFSGAPAEEASVMKIDSIGIERGEHTSRIDHIWTSISSSFESPE